MNTRTDSALTLSVRGWRLFPLVPNGKIPTREMTSWEQKATDDPDELARIFDSNPHCNIGLACGPSNLVVLDFDAAKGPQEKSGIENFRDAYSGRQLPRTYTVRTGSGGWHLYYRAPEGVALRNTASTLAEKVDTRAQGGYVVAPGSIIQGAKYEVTDNAPLAHLPSWLIDELSEPAYQPETVKPKGNISSYAAAALRNEVEAVASCGEGGRNHATNRAAWNLSRFVVEGKLDEQEVLDRIVLASVESGLSPREARNAAISGMSRGIKHFRSKQ